MRDKTSIAKFVQMALLLGAGSVASMPLLAAEDEVAQEDKKVERIEVTGSRIARTDIEGASPVVVISASEIAERGFTSTFSVLESLTQATGSQQGEQYTNSFTPAAQDINLRGLGPGRTLVLLNGRRVADYPLPYNSQSNFFNWSTIPLAAVERIEIQTDGASAIYGSDAIAGVVNVITKKQVDDTTITGTYGYTTEGAGYSRKLQLVTGFDLGKSNWVVTAEWNEQDPIYGKDRDWMDSYEDNPDPNTRYPARAILTYDLFTGNYVAPDDEQCFNSGTGYELSYRPGKGRYCGYDSNGEETLRSYRENKSVFVSGQYEINDSMSAFTDILYWKSKVSQRNFRLWWGDNITYLDENDEVVAQGLQRIFSPAETGPQEANFDEDTLNISVGLRGVIADYDWEVAYTDSTYNTDSGQTRFKEEAINAYYMDTVNLGPYGYPGPGAHSIYDFVSPEDMRDLTGRQSQKGDSYMRQLSANLSGDLLELPAGTMQFAVSAEYSKQGYDIDLDERTLNSEGQGWWGLTGTEGGGDRKRYAVGLELAIPVFEGFELNPAVRYDKYEDDSSVGGRATSQLKFTYRPIQQLMVRGGWSQTFRAPDMHYLFAAPSGFYTSVEDTYRCESDANYDCDGGENPFGQRAGNIKLKEETGDTYSFGVVFEPIENLSFTIDYFRIELEDVVNDEDAQTLMNDEADCRLGDRDINSAFCQNVLSKVVRGNALDPDELEEIKVGPINQSEFRLDGIDVSGQYTLMTDMGDFKFKLGYSNTLKYEERIFPTDPMESIRSASYDPRTIVNGSIGWNNDDYAVTLFVRRLGSILNYDEDGRIGSWTTANLTASMRVNDNVGLGLNVNNLTNERPPQDDTWPSWPYFYRGQYNAIGREVFVNATVRF
ncbi:outer membrane receptor protein [Gallaecimonas xiamenensis 3-C-1]|uniref:Outer membrane receptor protein n=2 Tax=Gallaecimonas TaxID=745410 RepID=K2IZ69_9GAMM|nr:outer membrane receptor protein [Gallaecimonas xiamenensis 3-C-1]